VVNAIVGPERLGKMDVIMAGRVLPDCLLIVYRCTQRGQGLPDCLLIVYRCTRYPTPALP